jgi:hypothetical protein
MTYGKEVSKDHPVQYYYVHPEHRSKLEPDFELEKKYNGRLLMRRK